MTTPFRPKLMAAATPSARMDALCDFMEFWLGPRLPAYSEPVDAVAARPLPMLLRRLYEFAGRWPGLEGRPCKFVVPALGIQDNLVSLPAIKTTDDGKLVFLTENQAVWDCRTLPTGDDPPVWCWGDHDDGRGGWATAERLVCESLSRFLTTFVLQEIVFGSCLWLSDEGLSAQFDADAASHVPVWTGGPFVPGRDYRFHLWGEVLSMSLQDCDMHVLGANHAGGIRFLNERQGRVRRIHLMAGDWTLELDDDGAARVDYRNWPTDETARAPAGTFPFAEVLAAVSAAPLDTTAGGGALVFMFREGQSGGVRGRPVHDSGLVASLFRRALAADGGRNPDIEQRFAAEWLS